MLELTLYHGNTESVIDHTIDSRSLLAPYRSTGDTHFLGDGYYFYPDEVQAKVWATMKVTRNEKYKYENWAVLQCKIQVREENYIDLDLRENQDFFFREMKRLKLEVGKRNLEIAEYKDKHDAYPPLYSNQRSAPYGVTRHFRTEKQYCIINPQIAVEFHKSMRGDNPLSKSK